jgi:hypothetical protein
LTPRSALRRRPFHFALEALVFAAFVAVVVLLRARGLRMDARALRFTLPPMLTSLPRILLAGIGLQVLAALIARRSVLGYLRAFVRPLSLLGWARICVAFMFLTFAYAWLKVCVPLLNRQLWDVELWRLDRVLHAGFSPNVFVVELLSGTGLLPALDLWYSFWVVTVFAAWAWAAAHPDPARRRHFVLACALLSIAGSWLYLALPALGPCYAYPELFAGVAGEVRHAVAAQAALAANYARMVAGRDGSLRQFNPYLGVAAFPSLHVGAHWLFALWARRYARPLFVPLVVATALTFAASLATGWHYAVDGYAGMLLAWLALAVADRLEPVPAPADDQGPRPAATDGGPDGARAVPQSGASSTP